MRVLVLQGSLKDSCSFSLPDVLVMTGSDDKDIMVVMVTSVGVWASSIWRFLKAIRRFHSYFNLDKLLPFLRSRN